MSHYILEGKTPVQVGVLQWAEWRTKEPEKRIIGRYVDEDKDVFVSTVFLGLDHNFFLFSANSKPILFETLYQLSGEEKLMLRYHEYDVAKVCHNFIVKLVKEDLLDEFQEHYDIHEVVDFTENIINWFPIDGLEIDIDNFGRLDKVRRSS